MGHFVKYAKESIPYAKERYTNEAKRLWGVLEKQLEGNEYVIGDEYTIADMAIFPWVRIEHFSLLPPPSNTSPHPTHFQSC